MKTSIVEELRILAYNTGIGKTVAVLTSSMAGVFILVGLLRIGPDEKMPAWAMAICLVLATVSIVCGLKILTGLLSAQDNEDASRSWHDIELKDIENAVEKKLSSGVYRLLPGPRYDFESKTLQVDSTYSRLLTNQDGVDVVDIMMGIDNSYKNFEIALFKISKTINKAFNSGKYSVEEIIDLTAKLQNSIVSKLTKDLDKVLSLRKNGESNGSL